MDHDTEPSRIHATTIEPIAWRHLEAVHRLTADPEVSRTTTIPTPCPEDWARIWLGEALVQRAFGEAFDFAVIDARRRLVGVASLCSVATSTGDAALSYWIGRPYWGRGHATAAARLVVQFGTERLGLRRLQAWVLENNRASVRVLEKVAFRRLRRVPSFLAKFPAPRQLLLYERVTRCDDTGIPAARHGVTRRAATETFEHGHA